jgi:hypothetical protein
MCTQCVPPTRLPKAHARPKSAHIRTNELSHPHDLGCPVRAPHYLHVFLTFPASSTKTPILTCLDYKSPTSASVQTILPCGSALTLLSLIRVRAAESMEESSTFQCQSTKPSSPVDLVCVYSSTNPFLFHFTGPFPISLPVAPRCLLHAVHSIFGQCSITTPAHQLFFLSQPPGS